MSILDKHMKKDIANLLLDKLSGVLDEKQKQNKIRNIVYAMSKKDQTIELVGFSQTGFGYWKRNNLDKLDDNLDKFLDKVKTWAY